MTTESPAVDLVPNADAIRDMQHALAGLQRACGDFPHDAELNDVWNRARLAEALEAAETALFNVLNVGANVAGSLAARAALERTRPSV